MLSIIAFGLNVIGGLGVFLYGLKLLSNSLQKVSSEKLRYFFDIITRNRGFGLIVGAGITALLQSSSATTVLTLGFVNAGIIGLKQSIAIIFGANIGTTITAQIIAFKASNIALPLIGIGTVAYLFGRKRRHVTFGEGLLGLGLLFYGLKIMGSFLKPLKDSPAFEFWMTQFSEYPIIAVLVGVLITVIIQSSSATTGMIITVASLGLIDFQGAFALELGSNIGTTVTAQIAAIGANTAAKRTAWAHTLFNVIGSAYMLILLYIKIDGQPIFLQFINQMTEGDVFAGENLARHCAQAHTFFNLFNAAVLFPFIGILAKATEYIIPGNGNGSDTERGTKFLDVRMAQSPSLAIAQAKKETKRMIELTNEMTRCTYQLLYRDKKKVTKRIDEIEDTLNIMRDKIIEFLADLNNEITIDADKKAQNAIIHIVEHVERVGDQNLEIVHHYQMIKEKQIDSEQFEIIKDLSKGLSKIFRIILTHFEENEDEVNELVGAETERLAKVEAKVQEKYIVLVKNKDIAPKAGIHLLGISDALDRMRDQLWKLSKHIPVLKSI